MTTRRTILRLLGVAPMFSVLPALAETPPVPVQNPARLSKELSGLLDSFDSEIEVEISGQRYRIPATWMQTETTCFGVIPYTGMMNPKCGNLPGRHMPYESRAY